MNRHLVFGQFGLAAFGAARGRRAAVTAPADALCCTATAAAMTPKLPRLAGD